MTSTDKDRTYYRQSTTLDLIEYAKESGRSELEIAMGERLAELADDGYDNHDDYEYEVDYDDEVNTDKPETKSNEKKDN
jgi:hypothetical protein